MAKGKGLGGAGLGALLSAASYEESKDQLRTVSVLEIVPGRYQPRVYIDEAELQELANSIREQGVIQPVIVREMGLSQYELIAGERRWRASQIAGLKEIPVVVKSITDEAALAIGLIENIQRQNLNPIEEAQGLQRLIDEFGLTHEHVAQAVGRSRSSITNSLRLLSLPHTIQDLLHHKSLEMGHARALLSLPTLQQLELAKKAVKYGWSVREVERRAQTVKSNVQQSTIKSNSKTSEILKIEEILMNKLSVKVHIDSRNQKSGRMVLYFDSPEMLDDLLNKLGVVWDEVEADH